MSFIKNGYNCKRNDKENVYIVQDYLLYYDGVLIPSEIDVTVFCTIFEFFSTLNVSRKI